MKIEAFVNYLFCFCADFKNESVFGLQCPWWLNVRGVSGK
jgi:hypothetical protein